MAGSPISAEDFSNSFTVTNILGHLPGKGPVWMRPGGFKLTPDIKKTMILGHGNPHCHCYEKSTYFYISINV